MSNSEQPPVHARQRLDKWLFFARLMKSRSIAQRAIDGGDVRVNDLPVRQASHLLKAGDIVTVDLERHKVIVKVKLPGERRGPFEEARLLYNDLTPPRLPRDEMTLFEQAVRERGSGRPTKKERRQTERLQDWPED
ncbi:RNA-binding S4 domain-containing protein [Pararhizobium sp.]|uniref:RNA-binding S4 domain-containing protein n=1 Tax=Pararhizobium sp. TaxID=1977563 RepID=UPI0027238D72|nr:RNA-binding S4 domain-containing protein [Pararhizobium sp.]MDO9416629.1 RNA-binding S4 domain-containing protein [Pararhizobium sp.]